MLVLDESDEILTIKFREVHRDLNTSVLGDDDQWVVPVR